MADSQFWQDLETQFRALDPRGDTRADWHYVVGTGGRGDWRLVGFFTHEAELRFELLARRAGAAIDESGADDLLSAWLDALKSKGRKFRHGGYGIEKNEDGSRGPCHVIGSIDGVCVESANLCLTFQIEAERKQRQGVQPVPEGVGPESGSQKLKVDGPESPSSGRDHPDREAAKSKLIEPTPRASRSPWTITSQSAARRMEAYLRSRGVLQTEFAVRVGTTDRTLRSFRRTGKIRRDLFDSIAAEMGTTRDELLKPE